MTVTKLMQMKPDKKKIVALTAYDFYSARLLDQLGIDMIIVGDSVGQVVLGYESTLPVTMDEMVHHIKAVVRGNGSAVIVGDMPFMSYQASIEDAVRNAGRLIKEAGAHAVKIEGGKERSKTIEAILTAGIPVMSHIGIVPQSIRRTGGYKVPGKEAEDAQRLLEDAIALDKLGVFSIVLECVPWKIAKVISEKVSVPTIGIGSGAGCDGQVLVLHDILGMYEGKYPKHVKIYARLYEQMKSAMQQYQTEVQSGTFPTVAQSFEIDEVEFQKFLQLIN
ncbi:MAG: 3-methyl-2-oxobutanoate hydroxymethyltransferase [bacterium]|nr:3-methyl-2-oxobutanoate hydroxymethyltransferase [bacterium]